MQSTCTKQNDSVVAANAGRDIASHVESTGISPYIKRSLVDHNVRKLNIPNRENSVDSYGHWSGKPGESMFILNDDAVFPVRYGSTETITGAELKKLYHLEDGVPYHQGEPDFTTVRDNLIGVVHVEHMPQMRREKGGSYSLAAEYIVNKGIMPDKRSLEEYMKQRDLVWHESGDCKTIMAVPWIINHVFKHTGGIGVQKQFVSFCYAVGNDRTFKLNRAVHSGRLSNTFGKHYRRIK